MDMRKKPLDPNFRGWGRTGTEFDSGIYRFHTIKPGVVAAGGGTMQAPHINFFIAARGINIGLATRMYFSDEAERNAADPALNIVEPPVRRKTLIAERQLRDGAVVYRFDIRLQGDNETVVLRRMSEVAMDDVVIAVAITGSVPRKKDNVAVPISVAEQIESTHEAYEAGASLVHIHVRNDDETPSLRSGALRRGAGRRAAGSARA